MTTMYRRRSATLPRGVLQPLPNPPERLADGNNLPGASVGLASGDDSQHQHGLSKVFVGRDVQQNGARLAMLRDDDGSARPIHVSNEARRAGLHIRHWMDVFREPHGSKYGP
jgi:hypothetical protein